MKLWGYFIEYITTDYGKILFLAWEHIYIAGIALFFAVLVCVPLGIYLTKNEKLTPYAIGLANVFETIPSMALLALLIPLVGIGKDNAIIALFLYALLPILQNTYTGVRNVPRSAIEAGRGMGMTEMQLLFMVQLPLALPVILAGIRVASVWIIGTATLAGAIGGGGLGRLIFSGLSSMRDEVVLAGAIPATLMALITDQVLKYLEYYVSPRRRAKKFEQAKTRIKEEM